MKASSPRRTRLGTGPRQDSPQRGVRNPARTPYAAAPAVRGETWRALSGLIVGLLLIATAVAFDSAASDSFRLPKLLLAETLGLASLVPLWLCALGRAAERPRWTSTALLAATPLWIAAALSAAASRHPEAAHDGLWHASVALACLVGWSTALGRRRLRRLLDLMLLPAALLAVIGLLQAAGGFQPLALQVPLGARFEMVSLAGNVGDLAMYLALPTVVAFVGVVDARGVRRLPLAALLALFVGTLLVTRTVTVLIAVAIGCFVAGALCLDRRRLLRLAVLQGLVLGLGWLFVPGLAERARLNQEALLAGQVNVLLSGRLDGWRAAIWMLREHPLTGVGVGAFASEFSTARLALQRGADDSGQQPYYGSFDTAHNDYLQLAAEQGGVGILALIAAVVVAAAALRRRRAARWVSGAGDRALAGGGVATLAIVALGDFPFQLALTAYPALLWLAWLLADEAAGPPSP